MTSNLKMLFIFLMSIALSFGFFHHFIQIEGYNFEILHIFLFNLCSGGTIILYFTENKKKVSPKVLLFLFLAISYAIFSFLKIYMVAICIAFCLSLIVESVRIKKFSLFPVDFFRNDIRVNKKFHQASLLCLSVGLFLSGLVILNNEFLKIVTMNKLTLQTFFLGFSFPVSLITMSVMFSRIENDVKGAIRDLKNIGFWSVNLGVIIFFCFILFEKLIPQVFVTTILFSCVIMIFILFRKLAENGQEKNFLSSGMTFLLVTAISGIIYIIFHFYPNYSEDTGKLVLKIHAFASLYGWNISGLAIICRYEDFPIKLHSKNVIFFHWVIVILLAPFGYYYKYITVIATISYSYFLYILFFTPGKFKQAT